MQKTICAVVIIFLAVISAKSQATRYEGQVVCCAECWAEADRTKVEFGTAEDLLKAKSCVESGDPTLLAVREGDKFTLYELQPAKFRLPGKNWLEFIGKRIAVTGTIQKKTDISVIRVVTLEVLAPSLAERQASTTIGKEIELALKDPFGTEQRLSSLKGRIVILNFWATFCIPCRKEMPDLASIQNEFAALGVQVIGASTDESTDRDKVLQFVKETKVNFPIWMGAGAADMIRFGLSAALPGTVIIDREGRVAKVISGVIDRAEVKKQIEFMLATAERARAKPKRTEVSAVPS
ncbi:MAG TPA: TlpA disulfide reductase family protein [Pyrinomonadaceae bacterium]|nr:TlpA disulfide reductase family protein [Pyrinomonadaceae bacterium]